MGMRRIGTQTGRTRVPAEMVEFVASVGGRDGPDNARIGSRVRIEVDDRDTVRRLSRRIESRNVSKLFWRCFRRQTGRRIEARIGLPGSHRVLPFVGLVMP